MIDVNGTEHSRVYQFESVDGGRRVDVCFVDCVCGNGTVPLPDEVSPHEA